MAAAYSTGVSTSPTNLLQTLVTWLVVQGWTLDLSAADGLGWRAHLHKGGLYVNFRAAELEQIYPNGAGKFHDSGNYQYPSGNPLAKGYGLGFYLGDGYNGVNPWHQQPGKPIRITDSTGIGVGMNLPSGSVAAYHFFDDGSDDITVVVERTAGVVTHLGFGPAMAPSGQPEDFPYMFGGTDSNQNTNPGPYSANWAGINITARAPMSHGDNGGPSLQGAIATYVHTNALVRVDAASWSGRWISNGERANYEWGYSGRFMRCCLNQNPATQGELDEDEFPGFQYLQGRLYQSAFAGALLLPIYCYMENAAGRWVPIGYPPSVFYSEAVGHGYRLGDVYQVGGLDYMVFPNFAVRKAA
jgi:hypothetical protein